VKVLALSLFIRHKFMFIKTRHRNHREKDKFMRLVVLSMLSAYHLLIMGFIWFVLVMKYNKNAALEPTNMQNLVLKTV